MKMSGSIRPTERKTRQSVAGQKSPPLCAFPIGTAHPGPGAHLSGPGYFFMLGGLPKVICTVPKYVPPQRTFTSYFIPRDRKSRLGTTRSDPHE
jgi:hypothetical protein